MEVWIFILAVWLFYEWRSRRNYQRENDERFARLVSNFEKLEQKIQEPKKLPARGAELEERSAEPLAAPKVPASLPVPRPVTPLEPPKPAATVTPHIEPHPPRPAQAPPPSRPTPSPSSAPPAVHAPAVPRRNAFDIEEKLGKNWLNKIGIAALVIGIALFLAYKFPTLSNPAKVGLGYAVSLSLLGTGVFLERRDRYRVFARTLIGGGWALTFFTTYAMHFVKYTKVIETQWVGLLLLFIVAGMMVAHTLRYDSQVVTGLAFLLAFTTVAISQNTVYSLAAGAILALGLVAIVHRRRWFELEIFGLLASYLNHYFWLRSVIEPMGAQKHMFPEFMPSALLLVLYWAIFRWSYIARRIQQVNQEKVSTLAALLNTSGLLALLKYQAIDSGLAFYFLLILGAVELVLGQLSVTRRRRTAFVILTTIGVTLLVAAIPFKFSGTQMSIVWLAQAQALFLAGVFTREVLFRRFGLLAALLTSANLLAVNVTPILLTRSETVADLPEYKLALTLFVAALLFYVDSHWIPSRWKDLLQTEFDKVSFRQLSYVAALLLFVSTWLAFPHVWTAVAWAAVALILSFVGRRLRVADLSYQAQAFSVAAFFWVLAVNRTVTAPYAHGVTLRLLTISLVVLLSYLCARWAGQAAGAFSREISELYTTGAALLVALLAYYECQREWTPVAWTAFALVLAILGRFLGRREFSYQAHALGAAGFLGTLLTNLDAAQQYGHFTLRLITFSISAALLYLCARFSGPRESEYAPVFSAAHTWAASILLAVLAYKELPHAWIAVAWAAFALLLLVVGRALKRVELHYQAHLLAIASLTQSLLVNLKAAEPYGLIHARLTLRLVTVAAIAILLYLSSRWVGKGVAKETPAYAARIGDAYTWAGSLLISLLLWYELSSLSVALAWVLFGLVLFEIGFARDSVSWRLQSYIAMVAGFVRIFFVNINAHGPELLVTTLPLVGVFYYAYARLQKTQTDSHTIDRRLQSGPLLSYFGSVTLASVLRFWLDADWVAAGWAGLAFVLVAISWRTGHDVFVQQSFLAAGAGLYRAGFDNFLEPSHPASGWLDSRAYQVGTAAALLFASLAFAFPLRKKFSTGGGRGAALGKVAALLQRPEQIFFFAPLALLTVLIAKEVPQGRVTMAWGLEAVIVFLFALGVGQRSFRLSGLGLLLICVGKIIVLDIWRQEKSDRFVTFIILGAALLLVSFLYTRYSEAIRRYL